MNILFAGSPEVAVPSLERIAAAHTVVGVLTNPARPKGRGTSQKKTAVAAAADRLQLRIIEASNIDAPLIEEIRVLRPQLLAVAAFGKIFRQPFLELFPFGGINLHPSLLPKYRGPSPIPAAILAGEERTGVTVQKLALKMDSGDILAQESFPIRSDETAGEVAHRAAECGAGYMVEVIDRIEAGTEDPIPQDESEATYCRLIKKDDGRIDWNYSAARIGNMIRAYNPWPKAFTFFKGQRLNVLRAQPIESYEDISARNSGSGSISESVRAQDRDSGSDVQRHLSVGSAPEKSPKTGQVLGIDKKTGILVQTGDAILAVTELQLQAKKALDWRSFLNGTRDFIGSVLGDDQ